MKLVLLLAAASMPMLWASGDTLHNTSKPLLWSGVVTRAVAGTGEVPECAATGCDRFDLTLNLPGGVWENKPGGVQIAIRWTGAKFGDNLRLFVYRQNVLIAKSDGIIAIAQSVLIPAAANGLPLYTRNPSDFIGLEDVVKIVAI